MKRDDKGEDFEALLKEFDQKGPKRGQGPAVGDLVRGKVLTVGRESVFVALADGRTEGMLELEELRDEEGKVTVKVGDEIEARVAALGDRAEVVVLRRLAGRKTAPDELEQAFRLGLPVEGTVAAVNKGGVDVTIAGLRAFCPISQLELRQVEDAAAYVGRKLSFRITKYEADRRGVNLVVSRRVLLEEEARARGVATRSKLVIGAVLPGVVVAIKDFGAFVDLGGIEGMLPASELGFQRGVRPSDVLQVGQELQVQVMRIEKTDDPRRPERISLSLKALERDPWEDVADRFPAGSKVSGTVTRIEPYGAFIQLVPGIEGLLHIGELSGGKQVRHARELVKVGETREVTVLAIDRERRRISLGTGERGEEVDAADLAAARSPGKLGTLGDLFKKKK
ncbi:MAG TPA: S1 RNA-binding domain-containing protein [Polyangia bacterium]|nr:S1 RNA-binding domain-containing protein [Polyangia bacterium]